MSSHLPLVRRPEIGEPAHDSKMRVGPADDRFEREADATAARVVDLLAQPGLGGPTLRAGQATAQGSDRSESGTHARVQRAVPHSPTDETPKATATGPRVQRSATADGGAMSRDKPFMIRRAQGHLSSYLTKNDRSLDPTQSGDYEYLLASWLLDQNIYDLEALYSGDAEPDLQNLAFLARVGLTVDHAAQLLADLAQHWQVSSGLQLFQTIVQVYPAAITTRVSGVTQAAPGGLEASEIRWHGLTSWGAGSGVTLVMKPGGLPTGSTPKSEPVWMKTIEQHHPFSNNTSLYVRGHLLNHNIGGPGLDYNMVPLTGKPAKNVGANDANAEHLLKIEKKAKETWDLVRSFGLESATYEVVPVYPQPARAETAYITDQAAMLRQLLEARNLELVNGYYELPPDEKEAALEDARQNLYLPPGVPDEMVLAMMAQRQTSNFENQVLGDLAAVGDPLADLILTYVDQNVLIASSDGDPMSQTLGSLLYLVEGNAASWQAEEQYVPLELHVRLDTTDANGTTSSIDDIVPVRLSHNIAGVYYRPFKQNEM